jgi:very-short-patch-repair endonuclease
MAPSAKVELRCAHCGAPFLARPSRLHLPEGKRPRFCGTACAFADKRGKTKETSPGIARSAAGLKAYFAAHPEAIARGPSHPKYGYVPSVATRAKMRAANARRTTTPAQLAALAAGRPLSLKPDALKRRGLAHSRTMKGRKNPAHSERMKQFYAEHPEKNPMIVLAQKGHETDLERTMRLAMTNAGLSFESQHPIGRFVADFAFTAHGVVIEVDGTFWHNAAKDALRDAELGLLGWRVLRFNEEQVLKHTAACVAAVEGVLSQHHERSLSEPPPQSEPGSDCGKQLRLL